ncbi:MAG: 50S ribosomal protein L29 [Gemmatimonadaceae bacterium]
MRAEEIREMSVDDIAARARELEEERFRLVFRSATEPLEDPLRLRVIRREIARLKTVLGEMHRMGRAAATKGAAEGAAAKGQGTEKATKAQKAAAPKRKPARATRG